MTDMTHPDILRLENLGVPEDRYCPRCGNIITSETSKFCLACTDELENMKDDEAIDES